MKENFDTGEINIDNPNDRYNIVLLKYLRNKSKNYSKRYNKLLELYPDNEYFEYDIISKLIKLGLIDKEITKERERSSSGQLLPAEFSPVTNQLGEKALNNRFPSEYMERKRNIHLYRINKGGFWVAVVGGISGIISIIITFI